MFGALSTGHGLDSYPHSRSLILPSLSWILPLPVHPQVKKQETHVIIVKLKCVPFIPVREALKPWNQDDTRLR